MSEMKRKQGGNMEDATHFRQPKRALLTLGAHVQRGLLYLVRKFVCLSVTTFSATTRNETTKERYQKVQRLYRVDFKCVDFRKSSAFDSYGVKPIIL